MTFDWHAVAGRIRGLVHSDEDDLASVATRLGVSEHALRLTMDASAPLPSVEVIAAVVRVYGLDPWWVLTGQYNPATHRTSLESTTEEIAVAMNQMIAKDITTQGPAQKPPGGT